MKNIQFHRLLGSILLMFSIATPAAASFSNENWNLVLEKYVNEAGLVDYQGLNADREPLERYIKTIETTGPKTAPEQFGSRNAELAYYLNAYNALVFQGVINRGPEQRSVWRGLISGLNFFVRMAISIDGEQTNLKSLEDDIIREGFKDPRIHAALNCASISCPRLPRVAFEAETLDQQLNAAIREFVNDARHVRVDEAARKVHLSKIFNWFKADFIDYERAQGNPTPSLINYVNRYREPGNQVPVDYKVTFLKYNKAINKQP